jgi:DNA-binding response OmpR family regulator
LRQIGVDGEGVGSLGQAEDVLAMRTYELVILEPRQPDGDGFAMLRRLKHDTTLRMPVIVLSARSGILDLAKAAWAGSSGYLGKPVTLSMLHATVRRVVTRYLRQQQPPRRRDGRPPEAPRLAQDGRGG